MEEIWKDIPGYKGHYQVSNFGKVRSLKFGKERILKPSIVRSYQMVQLCKNAKIFGKHVHSLVAETFLDHTPKGSVKGNNSITIDHIDGNPLNNNVSNLEVVSHRENITRGYKGKRKHNLPTGVYKNGNSFTAMICSDNKMIILGSSQDIKYLSELYQKKLKEINENLTSKERKP